MADQQFQQFPAQSQVAIPAGMSTDEVNMNKAIEASLKMNTQGSYEPLDLENRARKSGEPVGLKNVGNTCYFNSLMQILFRVRPFVKEIVKLDGLDDTKVLESQPAEQQKKFRESIAMVRNLQELFISLIGSNQKYTDPAPVLNKCVDSNGEHVKIGDQQDITEYAINFFERIEEVLELVHHKYTGVSLIYPSKPHFLRTVLWTKKNLLIRQVSQWMKRDQCLNQTKPPQGLAIQWTLSSQCRRLNLF